MQSFSLQQLKDDAEKIASPTKSVPVPPTITTTEVVPPPIPSVSMTLEDAAQQRVVTPGKKSSRLPIGNIY